MTKDNMIKQKRGLSPVVATVLLIGIVIVMALIVFMWIRGISEEAIVKFDDDKNVKIICEDVNFEASLSSGNILIANRGNVPIYQMKAKLIGDGVHKTVSINEEDPNSWPAVGLLKGDAQKLSIDTTGYTEILLIPVLAGRTSEGTKTYTCEERFGYELTI